MPPYLAKKRFPLTAGTHRTGHRISRKKHLPLTARTHLTGHRISRKKCSPCCQLGPTGSASLLRTKNEYPLLAGTHLGGRLTCGSTKLTGTEAFVNFCQYMNDSGSSDRSMSFQRPLCFFNLWSSCSSRPKQRRSCRLLLPLVAGCDAAEASPPPTTPTAGQAIPLRSHTPCYSAATAASHRSRTSEPSYSSMRGHPLSRLPRLRVVPFLVLVVVHHHGTLGTAW